VTVVVPDAVRDVVVTGVAAISAYGDSWRGLGAALAASPNRGTPAARQAMPSILGAMPAEAPLANPKARTARKMMSRGAYLAARALGDLMRDVAWTPAQRELAGYFLGVGASGGSLDDITALLEESILPVRTSPSSASSLDTPQQALSLRAFGDRGLAACNPLLAFQLMNNFTLAHGAILEGLGGPNGAVFSRGSGTTAALVEAVHAIASGDCDRAVAGGADAPTHPVTRAELSREGFVERGLIPADGAALLALSAPRPSPGTIGTTDTIASGHGNIIAIEGCAIASGFDRAIADTLEEAVWNALGGAPYPARRAAAHGTSSARTHGPALAIDAPPVDLVVIAAWGPPAVDAASSWVRMQVPTARIVDTAALGATVAAGPALGWVAAIDLLATGASTRVLVIDVGVDGDAGAVLLAAHRAGAGGSV